VFRSDDDFFDGVALGNSEDVASSAFVDYCADFAVVAFVRHSFLDARVDHDDHTGSRLVLLQQLAEAHLASLSGFFREEATCS